MGIRIYIEGGGDERATKARLHKALGQFLNPVRERARERAVRWHITVCGGRDKAFDNFKTALKTHPDAFNILLVDSEAPVTASGPWEHLAVRDKWKRPREVAAEHCHLMVQAMESWLIADREKLREYYGKDFHEGSLPNRPNVEEIPKSELEAALKKAAGNTKKKTYHKTQHAPRILEKLRLSVVCEKAPYCQRLVDTLKERIEAAG